MAVQVKKRRSRWREHTMPSWVGLPRTLAGPVARAASFMPLVGRGLDRRTARDAFYRVLGYWRHRLPELADAGWDVLADEEQYWSCYNCLPAGVITKPMLRPCQRPAVCPFCHARVVQDVFRTALRLGQGFHPLFRCNHRLAGFRACESLGKPRGAELRQRLKEEIGWRRQAYAASDASGGYLASAIVPGRGRQVGIIRSGVLIIAADADPGVLGEVLGGEVRLARVNAGLDVVAITAWALRYPRRLFRADAHRVVDCLHARRGVRMAAMFGDFREKRAEADKRLSTSREGEEWHPESLSSAT
jgi:hypothetical protein